MTSEDILSHPARVLTEAQRRFYFETGYLAVDGLIPAEWLTRLNALSMEFLDKSRTLTKSNEALDLGPRHTESQPHVRRLRALVDRHPDFWRFASESVLADIAADRVRPVSLFVYSSADAFARMAPPTPTTHTGEIVRGKAAKVALLDPTPCPAPPDWARQGYGSIFTSRKAAYSA